MLRLIQPGENFEKLIPLGEPLKKEYSSSPADEWWTFYYEGFQLIFTNYSGEPELSEIIIAEKNACITYEDYTIRTDISSNQLIKKVASGRSNFTVDNIKQSTTQVEKYDQGYSFLELKLKDDRETIDTIIYKRKIL